MDKTIEIVLVATVVLATAAIVLFLTQGKATDFGNFLDTQSEGAKCDLWASQCNEDKFTSECDGSLPDKCSEDSGSGESDGD